MHVVITSTIVSVIQLKLYILISSFLYILRVSFTSLHKDIKSIKPISGNWTLVDQAKTRYVYENESYRVYVSENPINDGYTVVLARNNWLELLHL